jgi:hypothetical protein
MGVGANPVGCTLGAPSLNRPEVAHRMGVADQSGVFSALSLKDKNMAE